jgi:hypothetical protein
VEGREGRGGEQWGLMKVKRHTHERSRSVEVLTRRLGHVTYALCAATFVSEFGTSVASDSDTEVLYQAHSLRLKMTGTGYHYHIMQMYQRKVASESIYEQSRNHFNFPRKVHRSYLPFPPQFLFFLVLYSRIHFGSF